MPHYRIWLDEEVLYTRFKYNASISLPLTKQLIKHQQEFLQGNSKTFTLLLDVRELYAIDGGSRRLLASKESLRGIKGLAILLDNYLQFLVFSVYLKVDQPPVPAKLFTNERRALSWLKKQKFEEEKRFILSN